MPGITTVSVLQPMKEARETMHKNERPYIQSGTVIKMFELRRNTFGVVVPFTFTHRHPHLHSPSLTATPSLLFLAPRSHP